ncbi:MAG TPA: PPC domain-containing DNA-binding protein [Burkholderiaceae bacterium]|nr:PPC domain-containing DNA-binding protein [Burkholderiaceae bacterium]
MHPAPTASPTVPDTAFLPVRLPAGADLRRALEEAAAAFAPEGCFVVSGIGSLQDAQLRLAARDAPTGFDGPWEILSLAGTLTRDGAHLHIALSGSQGQVVGGHVVHGNRVRTTAEVLLCRPAGWVLGRGPDAATGYDELQVRRPP